jgi:hypothetical protein
MMEVAHPQIFRAFPSPHPTTVDSIFRSLVCVHAACQIYALPTCSSVGRTNLLIAGRILAQTEEVTNTAAEPNSPLFKPNG